MGYSIHYGPSGAFTERKSKKHHKGTGIWPIVLATAIVPSLLLVLLNKPGGADRNEPSPLPWQRETVQEAFLAFSDSVRAGEDFGEAVESLYRQILTDAQEK